MKYTMSTNTPMNHAERPLLVASEAVRVAINIITTAPGQTLRFQLIALEDAQRLDSERERAFTQLQDALAPLRALLA